MCTAATYLTKDFYFGRTLDYDLSFGEKLAVAPRNYPFHFRHTAPMRNHYAIIGMAHTEDGIPLFYDGANEVGLCMAGLNFVDNAVYHDPLPGKENIATFEFIPWILGRCASVTEARRQLKSLNLTGTPFCSGLPIAQLHWIIADREEAIVVESVQEGLMVYDDPAGVLTNNPPFPQQLFNLNNYMALSPRAPSNCFSASLDLRPYSLGMGAMGLPGDLSSQSRFVRSAFTRLNSRSGPSESESVSQFFHILGSVFQPRGCCQLENGGFEFTRYTSCCNASKGIYYYTTYENSQITALDLHRCDLNASTPFRFPLVTGQHIYWQN